jgi:hypothetical protein
MGFVRSEMEFTDIDKPTSFLGYGFKYDKKSLSKSQWCQVFIKYFDSDGLENVRLGR